jgi:hypothetical protein
MKKNILPGICLSFICCLLTNKSSDLGYMVMELLVLYIAVHGMLNLCI